MTAERVALKWVPISAQDPAGEREGKNDGIQGVMEDKTASTRLADRLIEGLSVATLGLTLAEATPLAGGWQRRLHFSAYHSLPEWFPGI